MMLPVAVHAVTRSILNFVYKIIFSFNPVQSVIKKKRLFKTFSYKKLRQNFS